MIFTKAFAVNESDIVIANNIVEAKQYWQSKNLAYIQDPRIRPSDLDREGLLIEVQSEMEAVEHMGLLPLGGETYFKKTDDGILLMWVSLREALRCIDIPGPMMIARV